MDSPCISNRLFNVKQQSYIDLNRIGVETFGNRKHSSRQSTTANEYLHGWQTMNIYVFHGFLHESYLAGHGFDITTLGLRTES